MGLIQQVEFCVQGKPQGKARARTFYDTKTNKMRSITPQQTKSYEDLIRWSYISAKGKYFGTSLIKVDITAYYEIPKSYTKKKKEQAVKGEIYPTSKPDCDNIIKVVLDALNGVAYYDDKQVISVSCNKIYSEHGYIKVCISVMD